MEFEIQKLPSSIARLLSSAQTITSPASIIKELLENSLDAQAKVIEIRLDSFGLARIEVRDNGTGINSKNAEYAALSHYTSKLRSHDLSSVATYGFRGEALASVCQTGKLSILTMTEGEKAGNLYTYNENGEVISRDLKAATRGSTVVVTELFNRLPVRQQYYKSANKRREIIKDVENVLKSYAIILHDLRISLYNDRKLIWQKIPSLDVKSSFNQVFGAVIANHLESVDFNRKDIRISCLLPKKNSDVRALSRIQPNMIFIYVNKRPIRMKFINQVLKQYYNASHEISTSHLRYPCCVVEIYVPTESLDINVEPDKGIIYFNNKEEIIECMELVLQNVYGLVIEKTPVSSQRSTEEVDELECLPELDKDACAMNSTEVSPKQTNDSEVEEPCLRKEYAENLRVIPEIYNSIENQKITESDNDTCSLNSTEVFPRLRNGSQVEERCLRKEYAGNLRVIPEIYDGIENQNITESTETFIENGIAEINSRWSKGQTCDEDGDVIEGVSLFAPKRPLIEIDESCNKKLCQESPIILNSITPKESSNVAFVSFPEMVQQSQSMYQNLNKNSPKRKSLKIEKKGKVNESNQSTLLMFGHKKNVLETKHKKLVEFNINKLKLFSKEKRLVQDYREKNKLELIGKLDNGFYIIFKDNTLAVVNHHRIQESVLYYKMMSTHTISTKPLVFPEILTKSNFEKSAFETLLGLKLKSESDSVSIIDDDRISKNGFKISVTHERNGFIVNLVGIANHISTYSKDDLIECLLRIQKDNNISLFNCRPAKVEAYLRLEAIRINSVHNILMSEEEMNNLFSNMEKWVPEDKQCKCLHGNNFYASLKSMRNLQLY